MSTTLMPELALTAIIAHPKNPRHKAIADDDMVASVRENGLIQPVVVAPHPEKADKFVPIAGHRRIDAAKKAKLKTVPAILRTDLVTEGQQIEAMIIENGHRVDLTPIEEAEGFAQLELLGYKPAQIAAAVGRNIKTVRERLRLLKLSETTRKRVHEGQVTIDDAIAIGEFADDPEATKKLEHAATSGNLRYEISSQRQRRDQLQKNAEAIAQLLEAGATEIEIPKDTSIWKLKEDRKLGWVSAEPGSWAEHTDCLAFIHEAGGHWPTVHVVCTNVASHAGSDDTAAARAAEYEKARQEQEARKAAAAAALTARVGVLVDLLGTSTKLPPAFRDLVRALLPQVIGHIDVAYWDEAYATAVGMPEADRWDLVRGWEDAAVAKRQTLINQHVEEISEASDGYLARALVGLLAGFAESNLDALWDESDARDVAEVQSYYELLTEAGHVPTEHDKKVHETLTAAAAHNQQEAAS